MISLPHGSTLDRAQRALRLAARRVTPALLQRPTPCDRWSVGQVLEHAVLDQAIWAAAVGGGPAPEGDAFAPSGDLPADIPAFVDAALDRAAGVWRELSKDVVRVASPLPQGELEVETARNAAALDAAIHAWDIVIATGGGSVLSDELAAELLPTALLLVEPLRRWGAYAAVLPGTISDSPADVLLRYLGRDPQWSVQR